MKDLTSCSGPWGGFWIQGKVLGRMTITMVIKKNKLRGQGTDASGPFDMLGAYDAASESVVIEKRYPGLTVNYSGSWDGQMIYGDWTIGDIETGVFEMWPDDAELSLEALYGQKALPETIKPALPART